MESNKRDKNAVKNTDKIHEALLSLSSVIQARFPDMSAEEANMVTETLLERIASGISVGDDVAIISHQPEGKLKVTVFNLRSKRKR